METTNHQRPLKHKNAIIALSLASLIFIILSYILSFIGIGRYVSFIGLFLMLLDIAPSALISVYLLKFYNKYKGDVIVPIIFGLIALTPLYHSATRAIYHTGIALILDLLIIIAFILATISASKGFSQKKFLILALTIGLIIESIFFIQTTLTIFVRNAIYQLFIDQFFLTYILWNICSSLAKVCLYIALLLFGLNNKFPTTIKFNTRKKENETTDPEQALKILKNEFELNMITEEEYKIKRAEIISKL